MQFAESAIMVEIGGKPQTLYFNSNTMGAFEEATGKMYLETVALLYDVVNAARKSALAAKEAELAAASIAALDGQEPPAPEAKADAEVSMVSAFEIIRHVPMKDLQALIWAALHVYGKNPADPDEPSWPMTINKIGRMIQLQDVPRIFSAFLRGQIRNSPTTEEMGESQARSASTSNGDRSAQKTVVADGGERTINLPEDAFV
jgi:hypothetical protein